MRNKEEWVQKLRSRMSNHQEPVPSDLWGSIDKALDNSGNRKTIPLWRWVAAACVAAVTIATWMVMGNSPDEPDMIADNSARTYATQPSEHRANTDTENQHAQSPSGDKTPSYNNEKLVAQTNARHDENDYSHGMQADTNVEESMDHNGSKPTDNNSVRNEDDENKQKPALEKPHKRSQGELLIEELEENFAKDKKGYRKAKSGIKLFAQNSFHNNSSSPSAMVMASNAPTVDLMAGSLAEKIESPMVLDSYRETHDFDKPVTIGLSFSYGLTDRIALTTGVAYTKHTDHATRDNEMTTVNMKHTLYYIGIPVGVSYKLLQTGRLTAYTMAGAQADFNIKASTTVNGQKTDAEKDNIQLSVNGTLGVEYDFLPQAGLYIEPGIRYNIDNGSKVKTYFKKHDLDFNLQLGIRVNFGHNDK